MGLYIVGWILILFIFGTLSLIIDSLLQPKKEIIVTRRYVPEPRPELKLIVNDFEYDYDD
jgi:hypothetical protein